MHLIAAWNNPTQPPPGVTGTGLVGGDTTDQKITKVNGWTVTGQIPASFFVTADQLANCVNYTEFKALTAGQQTNLLNMMNIGGSLMGGSANTSLLVVGMIIDYFPPSVDHDQQPDQAGQSGGDAVVAGHGGAGRRRTVVTGIAA